MLNKLTEGFDKMEENENDLTEIVIDFTQKDTMNESFLKMMGFGIKAILNRMFGGSAMPVSVRGSPGDVKSFARTLGSERRYMDAYRKYGLDNPRTYKSKSQLERATKDFSRKTGVKWPFK